MRRVMLFIIMIGASCWQTSLAQPPQVHSGASSKAEFIIGPTAILIPEGSFLLVRKGRQIGAIKFVTVVQDVEHNGKSTYESYFQGDGSGSFLGRNVIKHTGEIVIKPMKSLTHTLTWQPGQDKLRVGKWWFGCFSPNLVNMASHFAEKDEGYEFAATSAHSVGEINASDKRLRWFRYFDDKSIWLAVSDLPK